MVSDYGNYYQIFAKTAPKLYRCARVKRVTRKSIFKLERCRTAKNKRQRRQVGKKTLEVPVQPVIEGVMGVGGLEVFPVLLAGDAGVTGGHGVLAEFRHDLELVEEILFSGFGWRDEGHPRDRWENFMNTSLACEKIL
ncbi:hypothetical protein BJ322DRAFT_1019219 [Thelephora terrestris]|nr:hypothetical protein BJ322DRAFT_1019219 [Thelephora terrestris]